MKEFSIQHLIWKALTASLPRRVFKHHPTYQFFWWIVYGWRQVWRWRRWNTEYRGAWWRHF